MADRNFDDLVDRFNSNIYQSPKGQIRLEMLHRDLHASIPFLISPHNFTLLDIGAGTGEFALRLACEHSHIVLSDISEKMLEQARQAFIDKPVGAIEFVHSPLDRLSSYIGRRFDLVLCHAVLEWLEEPHQAIQMLSRFIEPGGYLSLMFFNKNSLVMRQMLNGNLKKLKAGNFKDKKTTLTPISPLQPETVYQWLNEAGFHILRKTGIRVIYDYMAGHVRSKRSLEDILDMERRYAQQEPFRSLGRYIHVVCQSSPDKNLV